MAEEKIICPSAQKRVWDETIKTPEFKKLKKAITKAFDEYKKSDCEPLEIELRLKNQYLGTLF